MSNSCMRQIIHIKKILTQIQRVIIFKYNNNKRVKNGVRYGILTI